MPRESATAPEGQDNAGRLPEPYAERFAIQRRITGRDGARWRSMCYVAGNPLPAMSAAVSLARLSEPQLELRVMAEDAHGVARQVHAWTPTGGWV
jgi:hypothetical protein